MENKCPDETAHVKYDVNPHMCMLEGTFSLDVAQMHYSDSIHAEAHFLHDTAISPKISGSCFENYHSLFFNGRHHGNT